jgi:hypothetical protein
MVYLTNNEEKNIRKFYLKEQGEKLIVVKDVIKNLEKLEGPLKKGQIITPETLKELSANLQLVGVKTSEIETAMEVTDPAIQYNLLFVKSGKGKGIVDDLKNIIGISESPKDKKSLKEFYGPEPYIVKVKVNAIDEHHAAQQVSMYRFNPDDIIGVDLGY